ncbi:hypothetical protein DH2020_023856 [Rehmannia glutinosa]|uniref:DUF7798 domain-containing protein n=1 Tax=Rehmannia glutinosa TaxID=99300 RepID=A0ABR0W9I4_REHGL
MADNSTKPSDAEEASAAAAAPPSTVKETNGGGGGWGGWGFSPLSYLSDLQKAATVAAEEISRNAVEAARTAAKSISDTMAEDSESSKEDGPEASAVEGESDDETAERRKAALDKLEKASEDSILSQTGKAFTAKGMQVLELVGKETMDLLISETGIGVEKNTKKSDGMTDDDQLFEEVTFDRCFYIYGGPEQLEELEALSNHYALLYNRRKAKLSSEEKSIYDGKLKEVQQIFALRAELDANVKYSEKGKKIEAGNDGNIGDLRHLHDSSVHKAAELAAGFASALVGLSPNDIIQRTSGRLDALQSEGVHRLSEMCCYAVTQLLMLGKSIISNANKVQNQEIEEEMEMIDWPEDSVERAKIIRTRAQSMTGYMESVFNSFITGISDVAEAYVAAIKSAGIDSQEILAQKSVQEKASAFSERLRADHSTAVGKMHDGLQYLTYVVLSNSVPAA